MQAYVADTAALMRAARGSSGEGIAAAKIAGLLGGLGLEGASVV